VAISTKLPTLRSLARTLACQAEALREQLQQRLLRGERRLQSARDSLAAELGRGVPDEEAADVFAQATVCGSLILTAASRLWERAAGWYVAQASDWERYVLDTMSTEYSVLSTQYLAPDTFAGSPFPAIHLYEHFLHAYERTTRKRRGVFFTPQPIADYIVRQVDERLRSDFGLRDGLATQSKIRNPQSEIALVDPACGSGVFLMAVIDHLHHQLGERWNDIVPDLLPRLVGVEILPAAGFLAKLNIVLKLAQTGFDFRRPGKINIHLGDALDPNLQSAIRNPQSAIPVIVGNPPFSSLSTNTNPWISRLVRGDDEIRGYVRANGQSLGERKTWLHDDYVKFIRLAQWHVEQAGCGIVGFVTNHGYLDNATFRLMRHELLRVFPRIQIVDLHGNRKSGAAASGGCRDENVFGLDQGVAIGILTRSVSEGAPPAVEYRELWGSREEKLAALTAPSLTLRVSVVAPIAPNWRFTPVPHVCAPEYDAGWLLTELMPVHTPAPVTARDHFVVAFSEEELRRRIEEFRDLTIPDDEIRRRYFTRTRSARYESGDTRGWKLAAARRAVAADDRWAEKIVRCLYRPFDWRYVFWHPAMIDWPRGEVTRHLFDGTSHGETARQRDSETRSHFDSRLLAFSPSPPLALLARRQQLPTQPCTFFWISDGLALDGVIRSDNRGSESLFPLYVYDEKEDGILARRANFAPAIIEGLARQLGLAWLPLGRGDQVETFGPEDLLGYLYALFHSPRYRERYADRLRIDFPRVLPPASSDQFRKFVELGQELINLHLLRIVSPSPPLPLAPSIQSFRAGGYIALKKWLQPPHRSPADSEYSRITDAIARTLEIMQQIDASSD
jgi:predicted helicase